MVRLASYNVENLFARAKAMNTEVWSQGQPVLAAFERFNRLRQLESYTPAVKLQMIEDLLTMRVLVRTAHGRLVKQFVFDRQWTILRENRGDFLVERRATAADPLRGVEIVATGRADWTGWVELVTEPVDEIAEQMTARVINELDADVLAVVEAENRPALLEFNARLLQDRYRHVMLVDGNDPRGIDVGLLTKRGFPILSVSSHVDDRDTEHTVVAKRDKRLFSRDAPAYRVDAGDGGEPLWVIVNHLKSQSRTGDEPPDNLRTRQATRLAAIYRDLRQAGATRIAMVGDFNRGPAADGMIAPSLEALCGPGIDAVDVFSLAQFDIGTKPGTWQTCSLRNRLDYIFLSPALASAVTAGGVVRDGLWGAPTTKRRPTAWTAYPEITEARHAASDHGAVWVNIDL